MQVTQAMLRVLWDISGNLIRVGLIAAAAVLVLSVIVSLLCI